MRGHYAELEVRTTKTPGDAEQIAREWAQAGAPGPVIAQGGDGTVHEVINGLFGSQPIPPLVIIPAGTGNDFARNAGIPSDPLSRLGGAPRAVDIGRIRFTDDQGNCRTRMFLNSVSVGVSPIANRYAHAIRRLVPGRLCYALGGVGALLSTRRRSYIITAGDVLIHQGEALNITIANSATFGGGMRISPASSLSDGVLDRVIIGPMGILGAVLALSRLYAGTHVRMRAVQSGPSPGALRVAGDDGPMLVEADGQEFSTAEEIIVEILPGALSLLN